MHDGDTADTEGNARRTALHACASCVLRDPPPLFMTTEGVLELLESKVYTWRYDRLGPRGVVLCHCDLASLLPEACCMHASPSCPAVMSFMHG